MSGEKVLSFDEIVQAEDVRYETIDVPEWKGNIRIGSISAGEMLDFLESNEGPAKRTAGLRLIIKSLVNGEGQRIGKPDQLEQLKKKDAQVCTRIIDRILKLNGMDKKAQDAAKNGSGEAAGAASPTDLPSPPAA